MIIRKAGVRDLKELMNLWKDFMFEHDSLMKKNESVRKMVVLKPDAENIFKEHLRERLKSQDSAIYVAESDGYIAGFMSAVIQNTFPIFRADRVGRITDIYVKKEFRKSGIATELKNQTFDWLRNRGVIYASVGLFKENKISYSLLKEWGFQDFHLEMRRKV